MLRRINPGYLESTSANQFGLWTHLSELYDDTGSIIGRCAVQPFLSLRGHYGIGVINGLLAGNVVGIAGIVVSKPQSDLARLEAVPVVTLSATQLWAENQKEMLLKYEKLSANHSALLAFFGASHTALKMGKFGGQTVSYEEFIDFTRKLHEVVVHRGGIDYDDDDVLRKDFENDFDIIENLLELPQMMLHPRWLDQINTDNPVCESWSLDSALEAALVAAWGQVNWEEEIVTVGYVNGNEISRKCRIATRLVK